MKTAYLAKVHNVTNPAIKAHERNSGDIYPGDSIEYSLLVFRNNNSNRGPWVCNLSWPYTHQAPVDASGVDEGVAALLSGMVMALRPQVVFETGTHRMRSTNAIASALEQNEIGHMWTVDMDDYGVYGVALNEQERRRVTQIVGRTPEVFAQEPLCDLQGIDFAFIDGDHTKEGFLADLAYVEAHRAKECIVIVDNSRDTGWLGVREALNEYTRFPRISLNTMCGLDIIHMYGDIPQQQENSDGTTKGKNEKSATA